MQFVLQNMRVFLAWRIEAEDKIKTKPSVVDLKLPLSSVQEKRIRASQAIILVFQPILRRAHRMIISAALPAFCFQLIRREAKGNNIAKFWAREQAGNNRQPFFNETYCQYTENGDSPSEYHGGRCSPAAFRTGCGAEEWYGFCLLNRFQSFPSEDSPW